MTQPKLLSGGNPQIPKADGDAPVQAYIAAMPGWKREVGEQVDALVVAAVPEVRKAVRWNSPFYGVEGQGWFLSTHCFTAYVKLTLLNGAALRPPPPIASKLAGPLPEDPRGRAPRRRAPLRLVRPGGGAARRAPLLSEAPV